MDAVADAAGKDGEKPPFYYAEEQQQQNLAALRATLLTTSSVDLGFVVYAAHATTFKSLKIGLSLHSVRE
jgi:hypothetical protein